MTPTSAARLLALLRGALRKQYGTSTWLGEQLEKATNTWVPEVGLNARNVTT